MTVVLNVRYPRFPQVVRVDRPRPLPNAGAPVTLLLVRGEEHLRVPDELESPSDLGLPAADEMAKSGMIDCLFLALIPVSAPWLMYAAKRPYLF